MKIARTNVLARSEEVKKPQKSDQKEGEVNKRLKEMLDPMTQKLFSMLPPPKEAGVSQSLSSAMRNADTKVHLIDTKATPSFLD